MDQNKVNNINARITALQAERSSSITGDARKADIDKELSNLQFQLNQETGKPKESPPGVTKPLAQKEVKLNSKYHESVGVAEGEEADPNNAYQNWQGLETEKQKVHSAVAEIPESRIYQANRDYTEEERHQRSNMDAKMREINAPGNFTQAEADRIKQGLDPAKAAEVDSQVKEELTDEEKSDQITSDKIFEFVQDMMGDSRIGRNEKREYLRTLRQQIQAIESNMDAGRA